MSSHIIFNDGGDGLSYVKSTRARDGIVAAAAVDGSVAADAAGDGSVDSAEGDGSFAADAGDRSAVGCTGFSGGLVTGADGSLRL